MPCPADLREIKMDAANPREAKEGKRLNAVIYVMRWLGVVPAAVLGSWLTHGLGGLFIFLREPYYPAFLFPLLFLLPSGAFFTFCGGMTAPQRRLPVATLLAISCILLSLQRHVLGQRGPGLTNFMHFTGESLGVAIGVVVVYYVTTRAEE
jgi:hypothetical protein